MATVKEVTALLESAITEVETAVNLVRSAKDQVDSAVQTTQYVRNTTVDLGRPLTALHNMQELLEKVQAASKIYIDDTRTYINWL